MEATNLEEVMINDMDSDIGSRSVDMDDMGRGRGVYAVSGAPETSDAYYAED